ncbi:hypothetical protein EK904_006082 [Melospiza melodia maxima]|nr:hypothetical protein EK904_006082 [Melospiza melodia maxima]
MASDFFEEEIAPKREAVRCTVGNMNPAVHPILYLPEYGKRPSRKPECSWACSIFNHIKSCSELMVNELSEMVSAMLKKGRTELEGRNYFKAGFFIFL